MVTNKLVVPERGIVTIRASKPNDSEGEYGRIKFALYNAEGTDIWENDTYYSVKNILGDHVVKVGLEKGTYYSDWSKVKNIKVKK